MLNTPASYRIIIPALEAVQPNIGVEVVPPISKRIDFGNSRICAIGLYGAVAPGVVDVDSYFIGDRPLGDFYLIDTYS